MNTDTLLFVLLPSFLLFLDDNVDKECELF